MKEISIYVHIPFCKQKCFYCDFVSHSNKEEEISTYIAIVKKEIQETKPNEEVRIKTIYIGGGTPSYIDSKYITQILKTITDNYMIAKDAEITIEINPGTVDKIKLKEYYAAGINRISIGLQSAKNELLKQIGRIHTKEEFLEAYSSIREVGFQNCNIDIMLGLPNQTIKEVEETVKEVVDLSPEHISMYSLMIEEGTPIYTMLENGIITLPLEEVEREMYWNAKKCLESKGYIHYEISNFCKTEKQSKHNWECWSQKEYLGFGVAAHSYYQNIRYSNTEDLKEYIQNGEQGRFVDNKMIQEIQTKEEEQKEFMLLGLRKIQGVNLKEFEDKFSVEADEVFGPTIQKLLGNGLLDRNIERIYLTDRGIDLANLVWEEFV